jgi:hypothetical protein
MERDQEHLDAHEEELTRRRLLVIAVNEEGEIEAEPEGEFAAWEIMGIGGWLHRWGMAVFDEEEDS